MRRVARASGGEQPPLIARMCDAESIGLWLTVIICGRMITFFRPPGTWHAAEVASFIAGGVVR